MKMRSKHTLSAAERLAAEAAEATTLRKLQIHPDAVALRVERVRRRVDRCMWLGILLGLGFTASNVQAFASEGAELWSVAWVVAWLLDPMVSVVLLGVLWAEQEFGRYQIASGRVVRMTKWFAFGATYVMNTWESWVAGVASGIVLHSVPPLLVLAAAEAGPALRHRLTEAVERAYVEAATRMNDAPASATMAAPISVQDVLGATLPASGQEAAAPPVATANPTPTPAPASTPEATPASYGQAATEDTVQPAASDHGHRPNGQVVHLASRPRPAATATRTASANGAGGRADVETAWHAARAEGRWPTNEQLATAAGVSVRTARRWAAPLRKAAQAAEAADLATGPDSVHLDRPAATLDDPMADAPATDHLAADMVATAEATPATGQEDNRPAATGQDAPEPAMVVGDLAAVATGRELVATGTGVA